MKMCESLKCVFLHFHKYDVQVCVCVFVCACVCVYVCACVCMFGSITCALCMCVCVHCVCALCMCVCVQQYALRCMECSRVFSKCSSGVICTYVWSHVR